MSERPLLLSSAKSAVLVSRSAPSPLWRWAAVAFGILAVVVGAADVLGRLEAVFNSDIAFTAFAPAAALENPGALASLFGTASTTVPLVPVRLAIPSLGVDAAVEHVGKKANGEMGTPSSFKTVGWYSPGAKPGGPGNAVFDGHLNNAITTSGVFEHLIDIKVGATVEVANAGGRTLTYTVASVNEYPADAPPPAEIFAAEGPSQVVLITCEGEWVASAHSYNKRLVVVARLSSL